MHDGSEQDAPSASSYGGNFPFSEGGWKNGRWHGPRWWNKRHAAWWAAKKAKYFEDRMKTM
eukprot:6852154-Alexandrium_andersonii.AAC.1